MNHFDDQAPLSKIGIAAMMQGQQQANSLGSLLGGAAGQGNFLNSLPNTSRLLIPITNPTPVVIYKSVDE